MILCVNLYSINLLLVLKYSTIAYWYWYNYSTVPLPSKYPNLYSEILINAPVSSCQSGIRHLLRECFTTYVQFNEVLNLEHYEKLWISQVVVEPVRTYVRMRSWFGPIWNSNSQCSRENCTQLYILIRLFRNHKQNVKIQNNREIFNI